MSKQEGKRVPLTQDEAAWLMKIYKLRHDNLFYAGAARCFGYSLVICVLLTNLCSAAIYIFLGGKATFLSLSAQANLVVNILLALGFTTAICAFINHYMIEAYRQDAVSGMKLKVPLTIVSKEYYIITDQYFFRLENDPEKLYEVDQETYDSNEEGGIIYMDQGIYSGHIFGRNDSVTIKFFLPGRRGSYGY